MKVYRTIGGMGYWIEDDPTKVKCKQCFDLGVIFDLVDPLIISAKACKCGCLFSEMFESYQKEGFKSVPQQTISRSPK